MRYCLYQTITLHRQAADVAVAFFLPLPIQISKAPH